MEANEQIFDCTSQLTEGHWTCNDIFVARFKDIVMGISRQTVRKSDAIARATQELNGLLECYQRYREISTWLGPEQESAKIGAALALSKTIKVDLEADAFDPKNWEETERSVSGISIDLDDYDLSKYPLWKIIREVLRQVPAIRVYELEAHLKTFGVNAERSAIESVLRTHNKRFKITKQGREKFVEWKEDWDAAATKKKRK